MEKEIQTKEMEFQEIQNNQNQLALCEKSKLTRFLAILVISLVLGLISLNAFFVLFFAPLSLAKIPDFKIPAGLAAQSSEKRLEYRN